MYIARDGTATKLRLKSERIAHREKKNALTLKFNFKPNFVFFHLEAQGHKANLLWKTQKRGLGLPLISFRVTRRTVRGNKIYGMCAGK